MDTLTSFVQAQFEPTADQVQLLAVLDTFLASNVKCFLLKGYAGTGKTTITKYIANYLNEKEIIPVLMAPTGRASRILELKTGQKTTTIHKCIYNLNEIDEVEQNQDGKKKYKFRFNLNRTGTALPTIYLIDEASMISDKYAEGDFFIFGSGKLLTDLISFIAPANTDRKDKIIFIGDPAQLPPVTDSISGALSATYLNQKFGIEAAQYELTEVVRQAKSSGILTNATYLRDQLNEAKRNSFELNTSFSDVQPLQVDEVVDTFLKENPSLETNKNIIINYSNKSALDYNLRVRERLFPDKMQLAVGDVLIIAQNNYSYQVELLNGTMAKVLQISPTPEVKSGMKSYDAGGNDVLVSHKFRNVRLAVPDEDGNEVELNCFILDSFLYSEAPALDYAENIALYLDFKIRHPNLRPKTREFADALRNDPWFNALRVKYGYAVTCHKAQGGEWESAIVNLDVSQSKLSDNFLRWTYTAITRASNKLYLFNIPRQNQFTRLEYHHLLTGRAAPAATSIRHIDYVLPENFNSLKEQWGLSSAAAFQQDKMKEVMAIAANEGVETVGRTGHQYQERYIFQKDGKQAALNFIYNGQNRFSSVSVAARESTDIALANNLKNVFTEQVNIRILENQTAANEDAEPIADEDEKLAILFGDSHKQQQILYTELSGILEEKSIKVSSIIHNQFMELYKLERQGEKAEIRFRYDGLNCFTRAGPHLPACNSDALLIDIDASITELKKR